MAVETLDKQAAEAVKYFEAKLAFETGPIGLNNAINNKEPLFIIDLRTPELYAKGHVPGAVNILFEDLDKNLSKLSKEQTTVVYCYDAVCSLSTKAALHLSKKGHGLAGDLARRPVRQRLWRHRIPDELGRRFLR